MSQKCPPKCPSNAYFSFCIFSEGVHLNVHLCVHLLFCPPVSGARPVWGRKRRLKGYSPPFEKSSDTPVQRPTPTGSGLHRKTPFYALVLPSWMSPPPRIQKSLQIGPFLTLFEGNVTFKLKYSLSNGLKCNAKVKQM